MAGYSDAAGSDSYNRELSLARADAAREALEVYGADPARIQAEGRGEAEPRASNGSEAGRAANRRVEILVELRPPERVTGPTEHDAAQRVR